MTVPTSIMCPKTPRPPGRLRAPGGRGSMAWPPTGGPRSRGEGLQGCTLVAFAQPAQRPVAELADPLARHPQHVADLLERVLALALEAEVQPEHLGVARVERLQRLAHRLREQPVLHLELWLGGLLGDEPLDQLRVLAVADRRVETDLGGVQRLQRLDQLGRQVRRLGQLVRGRVAPQLLLEALLLTKDAGE